MRNVKSQERRVKSRTASVAVRSGSRLSTLDSRLSRSGLTLIELLITIMIISILAGMILGVASVAGETAREAHTRHMITRLHTLLVQHLDTYKTRRVKLRPTVGTVKGVEEQINDAIPANNANAGARRGTALAEARLYALREMMLMEIPDRWSDITLNAIPGNINNPFYLDVSSSTNGRTELASVYLRRFQPLIAKVNSLSGAERTAALEALLDNQGAECLYLVITVACGDGEARTLFHESNIGDTDGDGAYEFLDGWGRPINFLRWAPGFDSEVQLNANELGSGSPPPPPLVPNPGNPTTWEQAANNDHDPFDLFRSEVAAYRLVPLIFSAGRDETFGVRLVKPYVTWTVAGPPTAPNARYLPNGFRKLTPYRTVTDPDDGNVQEYLGTVNADGTATDNVHNHLLGERNR